MEDSVFELGETRIGESRIDDNATAYENSLTPDAIISIRSDRRRARLAKGSHSVASEEAAAAQKKELEASKDAA